MKQTLLILLIAILTDILLKGCANVASPTGGPRDTIPPSLISSFPINGTTNYNLQEFTFEFSEFIKADKIKQQLIITPRTENKYKTIIKKNSLILRFEEPFSDSTTYNFNFADGVEDITEGNPVVNLSLAFSTGPFIDSLSISGTTVDLFSQKPANGYTVGLYLFSDTLDLFSEKPIYFTTTNDSGKFNLSYIKSGNYKLIAFNDENSNITLDPETESHGFIQSSIQLDSSLYLSKSIASVVQNVKPITFINARPTGPYIELKYNKSIDKYSIEPPVLHHSLTGPDKEIIRIYKPDNQLDGDSINIISFVMDSLHNQSTDTINSAFIESNRKPSDFTYSIKPLNTSISDSIKMKFNFNKPIKKIDSALLYIQYDTLIKWELKTLFSWNQNRTEFVLTAPLDTKTILDSISNTSINDTVQTNESSRQKFKSTATTKNIKFYADNNAFISVENDSSTIKNIAIPLQESDEYGTVKLSIQTSYKSYNVQLIDNTGKAVYQKWNEQNLTFPKVKPNKYSIRILIDNNQDGKWSAGNILLDNLPEDIYIYPEETSVRENWVLEIDISF